MAALCCISASHLVPRAPLGQDPLQNLQPPTPCSTSTSSVVPRTSLRPHPLKDVQMVALRGADTRPPISRAPEGPCPLQDTQVPTHYHTSARLFLPRTPLRLHPFKDVKTTALSGAGHILSSQGHSAARRTRSTSRCPPCAASAHVRASQGHPAPRAHIKSSRRPAAAAARHKRCCICLHFHPLVISRAISSRATLTAASSSGVRVTASDENCRAPPAGPPPACAQILQASRKHRRSPFPTFRVTFSRSSCGRSAQGRESPSCIPAHPAACSPARPPAFPTPPGRPPSAECVCARVRLPRAVHVASTARFGRQTTRC